MPDVPANAKKPADHKAAKAEAENEPVVFEFDGETYTIDRENADNLELAEFIEEEKYILAIRGYIGLDQWKKWKDAHRDEAGRVKSDLFEPFLDAVMEAIGGKLRGLVYLLREHGEALEADFQQYYNLDLTDLWRGEHSPRWWSVRALNLPPGARVWHGIGSDLAWTPAEHLNATVADLLNAANWQRAGGKGKPPNPIDRPSDQQRKAGETSRRLERARAFRAKVRTRQREAVT